MNLRLFILLVFTNTALASSTYWGKRTMMGNGYARTFAVLAESGKLQELGIIISHRSLGSMGHVDKSYELALPSKLSIPPYKLITLDWNPHGHEPQNVYTLPHFDMHFYFISRADRDKITCTDADAAVCTKVIAPEYLVKDYIPTPAGVPRMGWHWVDSTSGEFNGKKFTRTFLYGYYSGKPIFIEPMVTLEHLQSKASETKEVRQPKAFAEAGSYPKAYEVSYNPRTRMHKISLKQFIEVE